MMMMMKISKILSRPHSSGVACLWSLTIGLHLSRFE